MGNKASSGLRTVQYMYKFWWMLWKSLFLKLMSNWAPTCTCNKVSYSCLLLILWSINYFIVHVLSSTLKRYTKNSWSTHLLLGKQTGSNFVFGCAVVHLAWTLRKVHLRWGSERLLWCVTGQWRDVVRLKITLPLNSSYDN